MDVIRDFDAVHHAELLNKRWLVASCHLHGENLAQDALVRAGYTPFVPSQLATKRHARKTLLVRRPLFPRYVLVGVDAQQSWYPILSTRGISGLITNNQRPVTLPKWVMENLLGADKAQAFDRRKHGFSAGQQVKVVKGPFEGFVGEILRAPESHRITVLLGMFGKKQQLSVPVEQLKAAS